jgi:hypothetical protein
MAEIELFARIRADQKARDRRDGLDALRETLEEIECFERLASGGDDPSEPVADLKDLRRWADEIKTAVRLLEGEP